MKAIGANTGLQCLLVAACWLALGGAVAAQPAFDSWNADALQHAVRQVEDSIVQIEFVGSDTGAAGPASLSTGTVAGPDGLVLTAAANVPSAAEAIRVRLPDGRRVGAAILGEDKGRQLVMLRLSDAAGLVVPRYVSPDALEVGQTAIAAGPAKREPDQHFSGNCQRGTGRIRGRALQTDARISTADYGGPLLDLDGGVLGIVVPLSPDSDEPGSGRQWYDSGVGFAVPVTEFAMEAMARGDTLRPGTTGLEFVRDRGVASLPTVAAVLENSPAAKAGLQAGDRIASVGGVPVKWLIEYEQQMGPRYAGETVTLEFVRDGQRHSAELELVPLLP